MIASVRLDKSQISTSRLGFGTSRLHYLDGRNRQRLLAAAADLGFIHFDTAPAYGDGLAELELGRFLQGKRARFIVATKYGIPADPIIARVRFFGRPLRVVKALANRMGFWQHGMPPLTAVGLRESAEYSLRRLKIDFIDIFLLHEPRPERLERCDEIVQELGKLQRRGLIRSFGVAGPWSGLAPLLKSTPELAQVVQTAEDEWRADSPPDISYGAIARGPQTYGASLVRSEHAIGCVRSALARRAAGVVLVSTTKIENLHQLAAAAECN